MRLGREEKRRDEFEGLLLPHLDALYGTALRLTRSPQEAEDLLQDACLKAYRFMDRYERGTNFKAWIFKILTNAFHSRYRKNQRERELRRRVEDGGHQAHVLAQGPTREAQSAEERALDHLMSEDIQAALGQLPADFRMAVILSDVEEFSYKEIAEIMDCPVGTVMSRLFRARRMLQGLLLRHAIDRGLVEAGDAVEDQESSGLEAPGKRAKVADLTEYRSQRKR
jgi:RNA polymerase sigma-70 factor (ECF subfamily)